MKVQVIRTSENFNDLPLPHYKTEGSAGMDLYAATDESIVIEAGKVKLVPTGIAFAMPVGYECQIRSRSGLSLKNGIFGLNSPGTIDSDYRGEIKVILANFSDEDFTVKRGDRIAQMVFAKHEIVKWEEVQTLDDTSRGEGGFGSTGK